MSIEKINKYIFLFLYYSFARKLPNSSFPVVGHFCKKLRYLCCRKIFRYCGGNVNIERNAYFGNGFEIEIGDFSGVGVGCIIPPNIKIGSYVMMAPDVLIHRHNHAFYDLSIPMALQGIKDSQRVIIGDDVWIGQRAIINPGRIIASGSIVASGTVLVRDFPERSIIGGNPSLLIRVRS